MKNNSINAYGVDHIFKKIYWKHDASQVYSKQNRPDMMYVKVVF